MESNRKRYRSVPYLFFGIILEEWTGIPTHLAEQLPRTIYSLLTRRHGLLRAFHFVGASASYPTRGQNL